MKVTNITDKSAGVEGSEEDIVMGISSDNHLTLLNSLTNLYSNPVLAALREYSANASDAHKDAGQTKPFEVDYPYLAENIPCLRIRDYGHGMTKEQLTKIYSQYGASTKGSNNRMVGGFGLGSKSGLAVSNRLFVNTVSNGVLIRAQILRNEDNTSVIRIIEERPVRRESGTEILLPLTKEQQNELDENGANELIGYPSDKVLLNGMPLQISLDNEENFIPIKYGLNTVAYVLRNPLKGTKNYGHERFINRDPNESEFLDQGVSVVMGGVYYRHLPPRGTIPNKEQFRRLTDALQLRLSNSPAIVLNIPVGSVDLPPHRDAIIDTQKSWATLINVMTQLSMGLDSSVSEYLNARDIEEASGIVASMTDLFSPRKVWTHRGVSYNNDHEREKRSSHIAFYKLHRGDYYYAPELSRFTEEVYIALHSRSASGVYRNFTRPRHPIHALAQNLKEEERVSVLHLKLTEAKYNNIHDVFEWMKKNHKKKAFSVNRFLREILEPVMRYKGIDNYHILMTLEGETVPAHVLTAVDYTYTEQEVRTLHKEIIPAKPKKTLVHKHCVFTGSQLDYKHVDIDNQRIVYMGGKGEYGQSKSVRKNTLSMPHTYIVRNMFNDQPYNVNSTTEYNYLFKGLYNLSNDSKTSLVLLSESHSVEAFVQDFSESESMGKLVMEAYEKMDDVQKLAVQHAYSLFSVWSPTPLMLFLRNVLCNENTIRNESVKLMIEEPLYIAMASYIFSFRDSYVEGLDEWKDDFVAEVKSKEPELAGHLLLPLSLLIEPNYQKYVLLTSGEKAKPVKTKLKVQNRAEFALTVKDLMKYIDTMTMV